MLLVGITLPFYTVHNNDTPFNLIWDGLVVLMSLSGILIAYIADTQLRNFMIKNEQRLVGIYRLLVVSFFCYLNVDFNFFYYYYYYYNRKKEGKATVLVLDTGIWRYSRRPNYVQFFSSIFLLFFFYIFFIRSVSFLHRDRRKSTL